MKQPYGNQVVAGSVVSAGPLGATLRSLVVAVRPRQWTKNLLIFVPLAFTLNLQEPVLLARAVGAFVLFCGMASAGYLLNDVADIEADRLHPTKRGRPIAAGLVPIPLALGLGVVLGLVGLIGSFAISANLGLQAVIYLLLTALYTVRLKHVVLLDIFGIAAGFVIRAVYGAVAIDVPVSPWLYLATLLGALLMALGKRRSELIALGDVAIDHRRNLAAYSIDLIDQLTVIISSAALMTYALYTFSAENLPKSHSMMLTIPVVLYGMCRYLLLVRGGDLGGAPEDILFHDRPMLVAVVLWACLAVGLLYLGAR